MDLVTPADKYIHIVIPRLDRGIQVGAGCPRITVRDRLLRSGMTELVYLVARLIKRPAIPAVLEKYRRTVLSPQ